MTGLFRKRSRKEVIAIKNKSGLSPKQEEIQRKLLANSMEEGEIIQGFISGKISQEQFTERLVPIEQKRIESVIEANKTGFKVEKKQES